MMRFYDDHLERKEKVLWLIKEHDKWTKMVVDKYECRDQYYRYDALDRALIFVVMPLIFVAISGLCILYRYYVDGEITVGSLLFDATWSFAAVKLLYYWFIKDIIDDRHLGEHLPASDKKAIKVLRDEISELQAMYGEIL